MQPGKDSVEEGHVAPQTVGVRRRFLITVMTCGLLWGGLMQLPASLGWAPLGPEQTRNNLLFLVSSCTLLFIVWRWPRSFRPVAIAYFACAFLYASAAQFLVLEDQLRMLLFFPLIGAIFLILGSVAAWLAIAAVVGVFVAALADGGIVVSPLAVSTFIITLSVTGLFFQAFNLQAERALDSVSRHNAALDAAAKRDHLTHLLNLRAFREAMQAHADGVRPETQFSVAFVDVDHFKAINDRYGHAVGDAVLVALARTLKDAVRERSEVARIGGEEFAILLPGADLVEAAPVAERLRAAVAAMHVDAEGATLSVTVSIGLAASRSSFDTIDTLLRAADAAMYEAKRSGRNRVALAEPVAAG